MIEFIVEHQGLIGVVMLGLTLAWVAYATR